MKPTLPFLLCLLLLSGCPARAPLGPTLADLPSASPEAARELVTMLQSAADQVTALRARQNVHLEGRLGQESFTQVVAFVRPDRLRLEFFATGLNTLTSILTTHDGALHVLDVLERKVFQGSAAPETIRRFASVPFAPEELMLWLVGRCAPPVEHELLGYEAYLQGARRIAKFTLFDGRVIVVTTSLERKGLLESMNVESVGGEQLFASQFHYGSAKDRVPESIDFWLTEQGAKGRLQYLQIAVNPDVAEMPERLFQGRTPHAATVVPLD
ncbi:MAG: hypothetical protein KDD69_05275 [Bdellovibrionales bacterium]|nr:hypothetical protein [Bdellovibrionales bacterium]